MTIRRDQLHPALILAALGALLTVGSLWLPWFRFDAAAFAEFIRLNGAMFGLDPSVTPSQIDSGAGFASAMLQDQLGGNLLGKEVLKTSSLLVLGLGAVGAFVAIARVLQGERTLQGARAELAGAAVMLGLRPVIGLVSPPGPSGDFGPAAADLALLAPTTGIWVALLGAVLVALAALVAGFGEPEEQPAPALAPPATELPGAAGHPQAAPLPSAAGYPQGAAAAAVPPPAAFVPQAAFMPGAPPPAAPPRPVTPQPAAPRADSVAPPPPRTR